MGGVVCGGEVGVYVGWTIGVVGPEEAAAALLGCGTGEEGRGGTLEGRRMLTKRRETVAC